MKSITNLISNLNNHSLLCNKKVFKSPLTKDSLILCKALYEEGVLSSFGIIKNFIVLELNQNLQKKKLVKYLFHKKTKNNLNLKEIIQLKSSFYPILLTSDVGHLSNVFLLKKMKRGGIAKYKIL